MNHRIVFAVIFTRLLNRSDPQLQPNEAECLAGRDGVALLCQRDILRLEVKTV